MSTNTGEEHQPGGHLPEGMESAPPCQDDNITCSASGSQSPIDTHATRNMEILAEAAGELPSPAPASEEKLKAEGYSGETLKRAMDAGRESPPNQKRRRGSHHHLLKHVLDPSMTGVAALKHYNNVSTVEEALALTSAMSQKDLQNTFAKVYGMASSSNNNNWLRKKLMEALSPTGWRDAWDRYMSDPFSNRGRKDKLRKIQQAEKIRKQSTSSLNNTCDITQPVIESLRTPGPDEHLMVSHQQQDLVSALNTMSNTLQEFMNFQKRLQGDPRYMQMSIGSDRTLRQCLGGGIAQGRQYAGLPEMPYPLKAPQSSSCVDQDILALVYDFMSKRDEQYSNGTRIDDVRPPVTQGPWAEPTSLNSPALRDRELVARSNFVFAPAKPTTFDARMASIKNHPEIRQPIQGKYKGEVIDFLQAWMKNKQQ